MEKPNLQLTKSCGVTLSKGVKNTKGIPKETKSKLLFYPYGSALSTVAKKHKILCCNASLERRKTEVDIPCWLPILPCSLLTGSDFTTLNTEFTFFFLKKTHKICFKIKPLSNATRQPSKSSSSSITAYSI